MFSSWGGGPLIIFSWGFLLGYHPGQSFEIPKSHKEKWCFPK